MQCEVLIVARQISNTALTINDMVCASINSTRYMNTAYNPPY